MSSRWTDPIDVSDSDSDSSDSPVLVHQQSSSAHSALKPLPVPDDFSDDDDDDVQFVSAKPSAKPLGGFSRIETATYEETTAELNAMADDADKLAESISKLNVDEQYTVDDLVFEMGELELDRQHADVYATSQPSDYHTTHTDRRYYSSKTDGDEIFGMMMMFLAVLPLTLSYLQKLFITLALNVLAPIIYGEEWRTRTEEVMKKRGWSDLNPLMAAICARRFGKTVAVGILAAMLLMCVPGVKIAVFAPSHKQAVALLKNAVDVLRSHPWWGNYRVNSMTQQKWEIIGPDGSIRSISAYASKHKHSLDFCCRPLVRGHLIMVDHLCHYRGGSLYSRVILNYVDIAPRKVYLPPIREAERTDPEFKAIVDEFRTIIAQVVLAPGASRRVRSTNSVFNAPRCIDALTLVLSESNLCANLEIKTVSGTVHSVDMTVCRLPDGSTETKSDVEK